MSEDVLIGGEPETVYRQGDEIVVSGTCRVYADEAVPLAIALLTVATDGLLYVGYRDLRTRIAAVLRSALLEVDYSDAEKSADGEQWVFIDGTVIPENLADAVILGLGLERQDHYDPHCDYYRYVTDWIAPND